MIRKLGIGLFGCMWSVGMLTLMRASGGTLRYLNELVGVSPETIRSWVKKAQFQEEVRTSGVSVTEREEILALRREVAELKRANEILKMVSAFFAAAESGGKLK